MSGLITFHEFERNGKHFRFVHDEDHQTRGSYGYETEEETRAAEEEELANLDSGKWVVLGCIVTTPCPGAGRRKHCKACTGHTEDSCWGFVTEPTAAACESWALWQFGTA